MNSKLSVAKDLFFQRCKVKNLSEAKKIIEAHSKTFGGSLDDAACMKLAGINRNTYYKYKRDLKEAEL